MHVPGELIWCFILRFFDLFISFLNCFSRRMRVSGRSQSRDWISWSVNSVSARSSLLFKPCVESNENILKLIKIACCCIFISKYFGYFEFLCIYRRRIWLVRFLCRHKKIKKLLNSAILQSLVGLLFCMKSF